jgi:hypothetical protein
MAFKLDIQQREIKDVDNFMTILLQATPTIRVITVQKQRELHVWPSNHKDGVIVELAEIKTPEKVISIGIEHQNYGTVNQALEYLQLSSYSMKVLNYVDCLKIWVRLF